MLKLLWSYIILKFDILFVEISSLQKKIELSYKDNENICVYNKSNE